MSHAIQPEHFIMGYCHSLAPTKSQFTSMVFLSDVLGHSMNPFLIFDL